MTAVAADGMLVAAPERWDEACFAVPAVRALSASGLHVGVLCPERQRVLWESADVPVVIAFPEKSKARAVAAALEGWQASFAFEDGLAAEAFARAGIQRRLGPQGKPLGKRLTHPIDLPGEPGPPEHRVRFYLSLVEALGVETKRPEFFAPADFGAVADPKSLLLCPDSDFGANHEWPMERWTELAAALSGEGFSLTVAVMASGRDLGSKLAAAAEPGLAVEAMTLSGEAFPKLAAFARVVSADGSLPHLAAHAGAKCVTLFGPNDPHWKRPLGRRHAVVRRHVECAPCLLPKCPLDLRCQRELEVERVLAAVGQGEK